MRQPNAASAPANSAPESPANNRPLGKFQTKNPASAPAPHNAIAPPPIDPRDPEAQFALFRRAYLKVQGGDASVKAEAIQTGRAFLRASLFNRGIQYKLVERAVLELDGTPLDLTLYDAKAAYEQAFAEGRIGRINDVMASARKGFEKCLEMQPDNQTCHFYLGRIYSSVKASAMSCSEATIRSVMGVGFLMERVQVVREASSLISVSCAYFLVHSSRFCSDQVVASA